MESSIDYRPCVLYGFFLASFENLDFNMLVSESVTIVSVTCSYCKCKYSTVAITIKEIILSF